MSQSATRKRAIQSVIAFLAITGACVGPSATSPNSALEAAIASPLRSEKDLMQDALRKPREFVAFSGIREGDVVAEINAGRGYLARLLPGVVGPSGKVYASNADFVLALFEGINTRLGESLKRFPNVTLSVQRDDSISFPERLDVAVLNNIYHDLHWQEIDVAKFNRSVFDALRPGGHFIVADHHASAGAGIADVSRLHRIERDVVVTEILAAGFRLVDEANFFANPDDDRTLGIFNAAVRGKTDRFVLKFRRPK